MHTGRNCGDHRDHAFSSSKLYQNVPELMARADPHRRGLNPAAILPVDDEWAAKT